MNTYQSQQFWNDINSIIGFTTSILVVGFMVGMTKGWFGAPSKLGNISKKTIPDYVLTDKGKNYVYYLFGIDRDVEQNLEFDALCSIEAQTLPIDHSLGSVDEILPSLENRNYISYLEIDIITLIQMIGDDTLRNHITIYYKIAQGMYVGDKVIDDLHNDLRLRVKRVVHLIPESGRIRRLFNSSVKLLDEARTRQEKVVAIDAAFGLQHNHITLVPPMYDVPIGQAHIVGRILGKLAKGK